MAEAAVNAARLEVAGSATGGHSSGPNGLGVDRQREPGLLGGQLLG